MFGIGYSELLVIAIVGLVVIGPKDLPRVMRQVGRWVGRAQTMARHFRSGIDTMMREAELEEMERKWREENERIMADHPPLPPPADESIAAPASEPGPSSEPAPSSEPEWISAAAAPDEPPVASDPAAPELPFAPAPPPAAPAATRDPPPAKSEPLP
jgi:sec-independent protein translocase protein TatB